MTNNPTKLRLMLERAYYDRLNFEIPTEKREEIIERHKTLQGLQIEFEASTSLHRIELTTSQPLELIKQAVEPVYSVYVVPPRVDASELTHICPSKFF